MKTKNNHTSRSKKQSAGDHLPDKKNCFSYAISGLKNAVINERNLRIHLSAAVFVLYFSKFYSFSKAEYVLLLLTCMSVIAFEMVNTAIESAMDHLSPEYSNHAKLAKDAAAGAVLISVIFAVLIGIALFGDLNTFIEIFESFKANLLESVYLGIISAVLLSFIFFFGKRDKTK